MNGAPDGAPDGGRDGGPEGAPNDAWNPGLTSAIPRRLEPAVTLFRSENASLGIDEARELADLSGLPLVELAAFRPERLVVHELLVRVTADYSVPDGPNYADLGISLRTMVGTLHERHVAPELDTIRAAFEAELEAAGATLDEELAAHALGGAGAVPHGARGTGSGVAAGAGSASRNGAPDATAPVSLGARVRRWFGGGGAGGPTRPAAPASSRAVEPPETRALAAWREALDAGDPETSPRRRACLAALVRTVEAIVSHRGRLLADHAAVRRIALVLVGNGHGAATIAERVGAVVERGAAAEGYRPLPVQARPVVMNVKGASASGKSTIRPRQRALARELGIPWEDFALISPDYWRKYLLDYASLGDDHRYGAMLCGQELAIVDAKLDHHMSAKAARGGMSHLLIDRFRFDSFTLERDRTADSRLLTRFGHEVYLFFMVTPPVETVERAWVRGQRTGRYKAVDDLLHHNVEAFTGMPALFLSWVAAEDRRIHFEFLDNDVPEGTLPLTGAFGWNGEMTILDVGLMRDIDRYRAIDVEATRAEDVHAEEGAGGGGRGDGGGDDPAFVLRCAARVPRIDFADRDTAHVYARVADGRLVWTDEAHIDGRADALDVRAVLTALPGMSASAKATATGARSSVRSSAESVAEAAIVPPPPIDVARERHYTVGLWASSVPETASGAGV